MRFANYLNFNYSETDPQIYLLNDPRLHREGVTLTNMLVSSTRFNLARCKSVCATVQSDQSLSFPSELAIHRAHIKDSDAQGNLSLRWAHITASNLCLLLQKEQNVKGGEGPSGKQAVGINNGTR